MKKKVLLTSILTIALCLTLIVGSTYALFTSGNSVNVAITAGKLEVIATIEDLTTRSLEDTANTFPRSGDFSNGGYAQLVTGKDNKELEIAYMTPGDAVKFNINVENNSNVALKYRVIATSTSTSSVNLADALKITAKVNGTTYTLDKDNDTFNSGWIRVEAPNHVGAAITDIEVIVMFPNGQPAHDNPFKGANATFTFTVEAVQANGVDGTGNLIYTNP